MTLSTLWVLADDRAGNVAQAMGVASLIGTDVIQKTVRYTKKVKLPNVLRGRSTIGIAQETLDQMTEPFPDFVISAGRRSAPLARFIKKKSNQKTKIIQLMYPGYFGLNDFDLVILPTHDGCKLERPNIMRILGAAHLVTPERLLNEAKKWAPVFDSLPRPITALIIGGATKNKAFTEDMAKNLGTLALDLSEKTAIGSFLVTTSRRTGQIQEKIIHDLLPEPFFFYSWGNKEMDNPYFGFLAIADQIIVTGDSVSMCSEACATDAPVYIYAPDGSVGKKHQLFHRHLYESGRALPLSDGFFTPQQPIIPLDVMAQIKNRILELG